MKASTEMMADQARAKARRETAAAAKDFRRDRFGHNGQLGDPHHSRLLFMSSGKGYVMARRPGSMPFVISEALWRSFPYCSPAGVSERSTALHGVSAPAPSATEVLIGADPNPLLDQPAAPPGKPPGYPKTDVEDKAGVNPDDGDGITRRNWPSRTFPIGD